VQQEDNPPKLDSWLSGYPTAVLADKGTFLLVGFMMPSGIRIENLLQSGIYCQLHCSLHLLVIRRDLGQRVTTTLMWV
jgi:hypothetical protein